MAMKKKFIKIELPILNEETMALGTPETLENRTIKLDLSRKLRGRSLEIVFALKNKEDKIVGYPKRLELMRQYIIRMMRKRINYVEDSFEAQCIDIPCTIKPFLITRKKVSRAIRQNLRKTARDFLIEYAKERNYLEFCENVLYGEVQKEMLIKLKKIYPLSFCEIRVLETKKLNEANLTQKERKERENIEESEDEITSEPEEETKGNTEEDDSSEETEEKPKEIKAKKKTKKVE